MFENLVQNDIALGQRQFMSDEVQYNLVHRITESESSTCLKTPDGRMIFAQSQGHNGWLWISRDVTSDQKKFMILQLVEHLKDHTLPGVSGEPHTVENFAEEYSKVKHLKYQTYMTMESYFCPKVNKPLNVRGEVHQAMKQDVETVAQFMAGFSEGAYGVSVDRTSKRSAAENAVETGNLYLWLVDGVPVSMANIAHRSPRHGRINAVFTPLFLRKKGYASALVVELCLILGQNGLVPMLYADLKNPNSNKIYKNIGFVEAGKIADIRFS
ncbi:GNAT family N-acetyltransferase [Paenibacillus alkalitolerans]|uniref:GNAT family N-acetyltransferase n=1 Tax=Paenibacillus alkalitolerans TaxID=2799335 RepID=UPI0018F4644C|nr:GNAT family N-acetyltransferase [Paenibacillus alkalitolerans]